MKKYIVIASVLLVVSLVLLLDGAVTALPSDARATRIVVEKHLHLMTLYSNNKVLRIYHVALGRGDEGPKQREGDNRTPEGSYVIDGKSERSGFYKSLHISYPSADDVARAKSQGAPPGGAVMIHGLRNDLRWLGSLHRLKNWTRGCIALTNREIDEVWHAVPIGTPIEIKL